MIEKRISEAMLADGRLRLSAIEARSIDLPEHSGSLSATFAAESINVEWSSANGQFHGDVLGERLQEYGQVGGLIRVRTANGVWHFEVVAPGTNHLIARTRPLWTTSTAARAPKVVKRRHTTDRVFRATNDFDWSASSTRQIGFLKEARQQFLANLQAGGFDPQALVELRMEGERLATLDGFEELLAVDIANVDRMPHQEAVARQVLTKMRGRAVLADEVGLGKTIEAGLVIKELTLRGLARRILILCPATLREQWKSEMEEKFELPFDVAYSGHEVASQDRLVLSLHLGVRNLDKLIAQPWDIVVVDEAHRAAGSGALKSRTLISQLSQQARYVLLLTATPVQNDLLELYRLVEMMRPGTLGTSRSFKSRFMVQSDPRKPQHPEDLRRLVSSAMIRTTRAQAGIDRVKRRTRDVPVRLSTQEQELYVIATQLLRTTMTAQGDGMRRQHLARRLATSPYAMGTTALRMAKQVDSPTAARVLEEVGHRAMDIRSSRRESVAVDITKEWIDEHGRVLMFTQHTDTVQALLRRFGEEGIVAAPFHGGMATTARAQSVERFRRGEAQVLLSTDAGAEGQNLQFCNCVLNYDLPWNPMRIEQRIGRVDRLTQIRDEVHVANLFALDTVDELVYKLLHDKLRMFELLFGQVTTILGEMDPSKDVTFEGRVMEALFSSTDARMSSILKDLGIDLERAREKGQEMVGADAGLSRWLTTAMDHRASLTGKKADELKPAAALERLRQRQVQTWVRKVIDAVGASVTYDTGETERAFITVEFPEEMAEELGGRLRVHMAFGRGGLEEHPDAELCAVGSPIFVELLGLLRERGDMHVRAPVLPSVETIIPHPHTDRIVLDSLRLVPSGRWTGRGLYRVEIGDAELTERILDVELGTAPHSMGGRALEAGDAGLSKLASQSLVAALDARAFEVATATRDKVNNELRAAIAEERERVGNAYDERIAEAPYSERSALRDAQTREMKRLFKEPNVVARLELLAIRIAEADYLIEETWRGAGAQQPVVVTTREFRADSRLVSEISDKRIGVLTICRSGHRLDHTEALTCGSCHLETCASCGPDGALKACALCETMSCGSCRRTNDGLCNGCVRVDRAPQLDTSTALAWLTASGITLRVGDRSCEVVSTDRQWMLVPDVDVVAPNRSRVRNAAVARGLPPDSGLTWSTTTPPAPTSASELVMVSSTAVDVIISHETHGGSAIDMRGVDDLPDAETVPVAAESKHRLTKLLQRLRAAEPPPSPPAVAVTHEATVTEIGLDRDGAFRRDVRWTPTSERTVSSSVSANWQWNASSLNETRFASIELPQALVELHRVNGAITVGVTSKLGTATAFACPPDTELGAELAWQGYLATLGAEGGRVSIERPARDVDNSDCLQSSLATLVRREIQVDWSVAEQAGLSGVVTHDDLQLLSLSPADVPRDWIALPAALAQPLLERAALPMTHALSRSVVATDRWLHHGEATRSYPVASGKPARVEFDYGGDGDDFGICGRGHFHRPHDSDECESCHTWVCLGCDIDGPLHECSSCSRTVCSECVGTEHAPGSGTCASCAMSSCTSCGADPGCSPCRGCARSICATCLDGARRCIACRELHPATSTDIDALPAHLAALGTTVLIGHDGGTAVVLLADLGRRERVILVSGEASSWVSWADRLSDSWLKLRLGMSQAVGHPVDVQQVHCSTPPPPEHAFVLRQTATDHAAFALGADPFTVTGGPLEPFGDPLAQVVDDLGFRHVQLPSRSADRPDLAWPDVLASRRSPLEVTRLTRRQQISVKPSGISIWTAEGETDETTVIAWKEPATGGHRFAEWSPGTELVAEALYDGLICLVARQSGALALAVVEGSERHWFRIRDDGSAAQSVMLSAALRSDVPIGGVGRWTSPNRIVSTSVTNGELIRRTVTPRLTPTTTVASAAEATAALMEWAPDAANLVPPMGELEPELARGLALRFPAPTNVFVDVGAQVDEVWRSPDGIEHLFQHQLEPGNHNAYLNDEERATPSNILRFDQESHLVAWPAQCKYCENVFCTKCVGGIARCLICDTEICRTCSAGTPANICPACRGLSKPTRLERLRLGRSHRGKAVLIGHDRLHDVQLVRGEDGWTLSTGARGATPTTGPLTEVASAWADERVADGG